MGRREYKARFILTKVADMLLKSPRLWHPGPGGLVREVVEQRFNEKVSLGQSFVKLQLGANDMSHGTSTNSNDLGDPVFSFLSKQQGGHRLLFVEANPALEEPLRRNVAVLFPNAARREVVSAAVCALSSGNVSFHRMAPTFLEKHPEFRALSQMSSLDRTWIQQVQDLFPQIDLMSHWEEIPVRCLSPTALLAELDLRAEDIDAITVDVEGLEVELLDLFLGLEGFSPVVVEFDAFTMKHTQDASSSFLRTSLMPLLSSLAAQGYEVHQAADGIMGAKRQPTT